MKKIMCIDCNKPVDVELYSNTGADDLYVCTICGQFCYEADDLKRVATTLPRYEWEALVRQAKREGSEREPYYASVLSKRAKQIIKKESK